MDIWIYGYMDICIYVNMYICMYVLIYIYIYIYVCIHMCMYIYLYISLSLYIYIYIYIYTYIFIYLYVYIYIYNGQRSTAACTNGTRNRSPCSLCTPSTCPPGGSHVCKACAHVRIPVCLYACYRIRIPLRKPYFLRMPYLKQEPLVTNGSPTDSF